MKINPTKKKFMKIKIINSNKIHSPSTSIETKDGEILLS